MEKILFINQEQFGYHIDTFYYTRYLKSKYEVTYLGFETREAKINLEGTRIKYISFKGKLLIRYLRFLIQSLGEILNESYDLIFIKYFPGCSLFAIINRRIILDIRTATISDNFSKIILDYLIRIEVKFFKNITIISESLAKRLKLKRYNILPIGGEQFSTITKDFNSINIIYVGTLTRRNIADTVTGIKLFLEENESNIEIKYRIIGTGFKHEEEELVSLVKSYRLENIIEVLGYIPQSELKRYFDISNIGLSYIPITDYYNYQPPTKTFEYLLSGMVCIATDTFENRRIINDTNGILIKANPKELKDALKLFLRKRDSYQSEQIRATAKMYSWENIINNHLIPLLRSV